jgi:hypothetical protein
MIHAPVPADFGLAIGFGRNAGLGNFPYGPLRIQRRRIRSVQQNSPNGFIGGA